MNKPAIACCVVVGSLMAAAGSATSYIMISDEDLADQAQVIVVAEVLTVAPSPGMGSPATDHMMQVEQAMKGFVAGGTIIVRVPGGVRPDGMRLRFWGAPRFRAGERVLLFLNPHPDGTFRILHLMLGAFYEWNIGGEKLALRHLAQAREVERHNSAAIDSPSHRYNLPRDFQLFVTWLEEHAGGTRREADYFVENPPGGLSNLTAQFTLFRHSGSGLHFRWFDFDRGASVRWLAHRDGQEDMPGGGIQEFRRGLSTWNNEPQTPIQLTYGGLTDATTGFEDLDGQNVILFNDPNDEAEGTFTCTAGGVLAVGGISAIFVPNRSFRGRQYVPIAEAEVVVNDGAGCWLRSASGKNGEEVFAHELGHTLGIGHSCGDDTSPPCEGNRVLDDALMRSFAHSDARGGRLNSDDRAAARSLYEQPRTSGPAAPSALTADLEKLSARLSWQDNSGNEDGFRIYRGVNGGPLSQISEVAADMTSHLDRHLAANSRYQYRVASFNASGESTQSNTAEVMTPSVELVSVAVTAEGGPFMAGDPIRFRAQFTGPGVRGEWTFGTSGKGFSDRPCSANSFCGTHIFRDPGSYRVSVKLVGDLDQSAEDALSISVGGSAGVYETAESFLQTTILGPRGDTGTFESDVWIHNAGEATSLAELAFLPRGSGDADPQRQTLTLEPSTSIFVRNVIDTLFARESGQGSIGITYMRPAGAGGKLDVRLISRSFVELQTVKGSFGQFVGEDTEDTWSNRDKWVTGILEGQGFVSTLLATNVDERPGVVEVELTDSRGQKVGSTGVFSLNPRSMRFRRVVDLFPEVASSEGPFTARFSSSTPIRFTASSTLLEADSEDQIFIPAREPSAANPLYLTRVVRSPGQFGVFLVSQLVLLNSSSAVTSLQIELWQRGQDNSNPLQATLSIQPDQTRIIADVIQDLFALEQATGALKITWQNDLNEAPRILSYALSQSPAGGRFGMLVDSRTEAEAVANRAIDFAAEQSDLFLASYGAVNLLRAVTELELTLRAGDGTAIATKSRTLKPQQHLELNLAGLFSDGDIGSGENWYVETAVTSGGPVLTYLANINASGDIFFVPGRGVE